MIAYFPGLYPDELVYSVLSRCYEKSGFLSYIHAAEQIMQNPLDRPKPEFINAYTDNAYAVLTKNVSMTDLIFHHTMFPYFARFLPPDRRNAALEAILNATPNFCYKIVYPVSRNRERRYLRYCPVCVECDRHQYGETYWHRNHQFIGVSICPVHHCYLTDSEVEISSKAADIRGRKIY